MPQSVIEGDPPQRDDDSDGREAESDPGDLDFAERLARLDLAKLRVAIKFVQDEVPPYGLPNKESGGSIAGDWVPPSIDLCRRRALVAAYAHIERGFAPVTGPGTGEPAT